MESSNQVSCASQKHVEPSKSLGGEQEQSSKLEADTGGLEITEQGRQIPGEIWASGFLKKAIRRFWKTARSPPSFIFFYSKESHKYYEKVEKIIRLQV